MRQLSNEETCASCQKPIEPGHVRYRTGDSDWHLRCVDSKGVPAGKATILLVDDEPEMRGVLREVLAPRAYAVLETGDSEDALRIAREHCGPIHVLLTDVVMPGLEGPELAERVRPLRPEMKILFMSAYEVVNRLKPGAVFLSKPFTVKELVTKLEA